MAKPQTTVVDAESHLHRGGQQCFSRWAVNLLTIGGLGGGLLAVVPAVTVYASPTAEIETDKPVEATDLVPEKTVWSDPSADQVWTPPENIGTLAEAMQIEVEAPDVSADLEARVLEDTAAEELGIAGVLIEVSGDDAGSGEVTVNYAELRSAFGADWDSRIQILELPACAVLTPETEGCLNAEPLPAEIDPETDAITIDLANTSAAESSGSEVTVLAVTAAAATDTSNGDYSATKLESIGAWEAGSNTGAFTYSVPIGLPPAEGPAHGVTLSYSSAVHDGRTSGRNNQASWIGDGWSYEPGYVERTYSACSDDLGSGANNDENDFTADQCWDGESNHLTVSLAGTSATLVKDDVTGTWFVDTGAAWKIERLGSAASASAATSEHWKITTEDGTAYYFGSDSTSRLTMPVFGNHSEEPCHATEFADSSCKQTYRWMIDKAVDTSDNMTRYYYITKNGAYGAAADADNRTTYVREAYLSRIDYGLRDDDSSVQATGRAVFTTADRCEATCYDDSGDLIESAWPDVPWDLHCDAAPCTTQHSPAFFDTKKLTTITTQVRNGTTWRDVDQWKLEHEFKTYGSENQVVLWLKSIQRVGKPGDDIALPKIEFGGYALPNRVEVADRIPLWRWRMSSIKTETGAVINIGYSEPVCATLPSKSANTKRCFPVLSKPHGQSETVEDWFHKYVVTEVTETDPVTESPAIMTFYDYSTSGGGTSMLWAWDDSAHTREAERTYNQWRGYAQVTTRFGDPYDGPQEISRVRYYRGMNGQPLPDGNTRSVSLTDAEGGTVIDHEALAGKMFEQVAFDGSQIVEGAVTRYWTSRAASQDHDGGSYESWRISPSRQDTRRWLTGTTWQRTRVETTFDSLGRAIAVSDYGDTGASGDETCKRTGYADSADANIYILPAHQETVAVTCDTTPTRPDDVLSASRYYYDGHSSIDDAPTKGLVTRTDVLDSWPSDGGASYVTEETLSYDTLGRVTKTVDALDRAVTTTYTPSGAGPLTQKTVTNPLGHVTTTTMDPAWRAATKIVDATGRTTEVAYDALGRIIAVWQPGRAKATETASKTFTYIVSDTAPSAVTTRELGAYGDYVTTIDLYDALLRPRQTQTDTIGGARLLTLNRYDSHGRVEETRGPDFNAAPPSTTIAVVARGNSVDRIEYVFDAVGRTTDEIQYRRQTELWRTSTTYGGSTDGYRITVSPPEGAPATATIENARRVLQEQRTFQSNQPVGVYDTTAYAYTPLAELSAVTDQAGNVWSWEYDLRRRQIKSHDPDTGTNTIVYDLAGQVVFTTDARGQSLAYTHDELGRMTERRDGDGTLLAAWTFDTVEGGIGLPATSTRYVDGAAYTESVYSYDEAGRVTATEIAIPDSEGGLAGYYYTSRSYYDNGQTAFSGYSPMGGVSTQILQYSYDEVGNQTGILSDIDGNTVAVVDEATYTPFGEIQTRRLNSSANNKFAYQGYQYEETTRRLQRFTFDHQTTAPSIADVRYTYDDAGNMLSIADLPADDTARWERQCFAYDSQRRLVEAWSQAGAGTCVANDSASNMGGPAPYWNSYTYDALGNRTGDTLNQLGTDGQARTFAYPAAGDPHPHAVTAIDNADGTTDTYTYDASGNLTSRTADGETITFQWDAENANTLISGNDWQARIVYDANGDQLIRDDGDTATLFLPETEIMWDKQVGALDSTRYIQHAGDTVVACKGSSMSLWRWIGDDHHGTASYSVNAVGHSGASVRYYDPFGMIRQETTGEWYGEQSFVGGTELNGGFVRLGARTYDPAIGRFISVDPIADFADAQQINGYAYSHNNPVTYTDPTGLKDMISDGAGGSSKSQKASRAQKGNPKPVPKTPSPSPGPSPSPPFPEGCDLEFPCNESDLGWLDLLNDFRNGNGSDFVFYPGDRMSSSLSEDKWLINYIRSQLADGKDMGAYSKNLGVMGDVGVQIYYAYNAWTMLAEGLFGYDSGMNRDTVYMGGYSVDWSIRSESGGVYEVLAVIENSTTVTSGTRKPEGGYGEDPSFLDGETLEQFNERFPEQNQTIYVVLTIDMNEPCVGECGVNPLPTPPGGK